MPAPMKTSLFRIGPAFPLPASTDRPPSDLRGLGRVVSEG